MPYSSMPAARDSCTTWLAIDITWRVEVPVQMIMQSVMLDLPLDVQSDNVLAFQVIDFIDDEILERFTLQRFPSGVFCSVGCGGQNARRGVTG